MDKKVSVISGIYNCSGTLSEAIECILNQSYTNWELILCDDGSTDNTYEIAKDYARRYPEKIFLLKNDKNRGLNYTLNHCLQYASGEYIARMDGDDHCSKERFEKELEVFDTEPDLAIVSTDMVYFDESGIWGRIGHPDDPERGDFPHESPFCQAPCMVKKEAYDAVNGYTVDNRLLRVEDYHLWIKMYASGFRGKNIHELLYQMRDDRNAYRRRKFKYRWNEAYVKYLAVKELDLPKWMLIYALRPIITGLMPDFLYNWLHKKRLRK
ncbi:MAG: glycosyltransferase [Clostridiales bacterium]|nr:glycosyltransferase [Clostridiales bacterium]